MAAIVLLGGSGSGSGSVDEGPTTEPAGATAASAAPAAPAEPEEAEPVQEEPAKEQPVEEEPPAPNLSSEAACRESGPVMEEVFESLTRATEGIITSDEGVDALLKAQQKLDALADRLADPAVAGPIRGLADGVGKMRVSIIEVDDSGMAGRDFQAAGKRMLDACRDVFK